MLTIAGLGYGPQLRGLGASSYACAGNVCTGNSTDVATEFRRLQALINQLAGQLGIGSPLAVDGKIGPATAAKLVLVASAMPFRSDLPELMDLGSSISPSSLAALASVYVAELEAAVSGEIQMPGETVGPPVKPKPGSGSLPNQTAVTTAPHGHTVPRVNTPVLPTVTLPGGGTLSTPAIAAIAIGAVGLITAGIVVARRRRAPTAVAGARRRR